MNATDLNGTLQFLKAAEQLKNTLRTGITSEGRNESVAEHTWRLCLMAMVFEKDFSEISFNRLIKLCIIHDLGEVINGDIPATEQIDNPAKSDTERKDFKTLISSLPNQQQEEMLSLWDEYEYVKSPEAKVAKALDKLETILQHNQGVNPPGFDYQFNLEYGSEYMTGNPLIVQIRKIIDEETKHRIKNG